MKRVIRSKPEHGLGEQDLTLRMAANAIWNKLNFGLHLLAQLKCTEQTSRIKDQLQQDMVEARALADSIVKADGSDE